MMIDIAKHVGWWLYVALAFAATTRIVFEVLKLVWDQGAIGEHVDFGDALIATVKTVIGWIKLMKSNWFATVCAVAIFMLLWGSTEVGMYASLGFSAMSYAIGGVCTPMILRVLKPKASMIHQAIQPDKSTDS